MSVFKKNLRFDVSIILKETFFSFPVLSESHKVFDCFSRFIMLRMRFRTLLGLALLVSTSGWSQNPATVFAIPDRNIELPCGTTCTSITATVPNIKQTNNYIVNSMPYLPFDWTTAGGIDVRTLTGTTLFDDRWTSPINFPFCFWGMTYGSLLIGTNSAITFDVTRSQTGSGYAINNPIPNTAYAPAMIFGPYHDINIDATPLPGSRIEYRIEGTAPNRRFIVSYNQVPYFGSSCTNMWATHQMVLYEGTGVIEVYIKDKPACTAWNSGLTILGVQDHTQTQAVAVPGYNATVWGSNNMNVAYRFTPSGGVSRYKSAQLLLNGNVVATADTSSLNSPAGHMELTFGNVCPNDANTMYVLRLTYGLCNDPSQDVNFYDTIYVTKQTPTFTLTKVDADCAGNGSITASVTGGTGNFMFSLNGGAFQASNTFTGLSEGTYVVTTQNENNCSFSQSIVLDLNNNLTLSVLPQDTSLCEGAAFTPIVTSAASSYVWSGPAEFSSGGVIAQPSISPRASGLVVVTAAEGPCVAEDTINVTVFAGPQADAGPDVSIVIGGSATLQASAAPGTYVWSPSSGLSATNILNPVASPGQTTTYTLTATTPEGCTSTDNVTVTVLDCVDPMEAFTPNGDGMNDYWLVNMSACYRTAIVQVFNRYGTKVYESRNYANNWDGTWKGKPLPDGTYYYVITLDLVNGKRVQYKGNVTILR